jgi:hypothetical protein
MVISFYRHSARRWKDGVEDNSLDGLARLHVIAISQVRM